MKQKYIIALIVGLLGGLLFFSSTAVSAPLPQTPTPQYAIDYGRMRTCTVTNMGAGPSYCEIVWSNPSYPYSSTRLIGWWVIAEASDYQENFAAGLEGGVAAPPYIYAGVDSLLIDRIRQTNTLNAQSDTWAHHAADGLTGFPGGGGQCVDFLVFFPGQPCEGTRTFASVYTSTVLWEELRLKFYVTGSDPYGTGHPQDEGDPQATVEFTVYPLVYITDGSTLPTATPTATGTSVYATQLPFPTEVCITATVGAATPTPFYSGSATPTPTGTLVTATPTGTYIAPTSTVTPTAGAADIYVSDVWEFDQSLSPWTKVSVFQFPAPVEAAWTGETGPDGISGTVRLTYNAISRPVTSTVAPVGGIVWTRGSNIPAPLYLKTSVKSDGIFAGTYNFLVLHVKDVRGYWAVHDFELIGTGWREITFYTAEFAPYVAIGLAAYSCNGPEWNTCNPKAYNDGTSAGALIDNVQILAGSYANTLATRPCPESGSENEYRVCRLYINTIDVAAVCQAPDDWLNVGGWLSWLGCRIEKYFAFDQIVNGAQLQSMYTFGYTQEPLGSAADMAILIQEGRDSFEQARAEQPGTFSVPDMDVFFSTGGLEPIVLTVPGNNDDYLIQCPEQFDTVNEGIRKGLCFSIYAVKTQPASYVFIQALNWLANLAAFIFLLQIVRMSIQTASM